MASSLVASRAQLIYALCLPLAVLMGYFLASPTDVSSIAIFVLILSFLMVPLLMKYYHPLLVACWNAAITPYFIPGSPHLWMLLSVVGFGFAIINRSTNPDARLVNVPTLNTIMIVMLGIVCATAILRGGVGVRSLGSSTFGGKNYIAVVTALFGYFALISQRIPLNRAQAYVGFYFLSSLTALVPNLAFLGGSKLYFLYIMFPAFLAQEQALSAFSGSAEFTRFTGLTFASMGFYCWLLARYGLRGLFDWTRPWKMGLFMLAFLGCLATGFRSFLLLFLITVTLQFIAERLFNLRTLLTLGAIILVVAGVTLPNAAHLPPVIQRSLSFLPIEISPAIRQSAAGSADWRYRMWQDVMMQIPEYLVLGKGYAINPGDLQFAEENTRRGYSPDYTGALVAGDYHNGPLTVIVPFGIPGVLALAALFIWGLRYLYQQYQYGDASLKKINRFLLVFFTAKIIYFLFIFGTLYYDLFSFTGLLGLSVSLNGPILQNGRNGMGEAKILADHRTRRN